jgi:VanZ family protein
MMTSFFAKPSWRWSLAILYAGLLAVGSALPSGTGPLKGWDASLSPGVQNLLHFPAYALLAALVLLAVGKPAGAAPILPIMAAALSCVAYGALLEGLQAAGIPGRTGSVSDVIWDTAGVATGVAVWRIWPAMARAWVAFAGKSA